jgi:SPX domain protein involved in polyphosphate accumulation
MSLEVPEGCRYEIKFVGRSSEHHRLRGWLRQNFVGFGTAYPDRIVNNIYFDSFDYDSFAQNLSGASQRTKLRYRWYGESVTPDRGDLELKCKRNFFGWKLRSGVAEKPYETGDSWRLVRQRMMAQVNPEGRLWLGQHPFPVLINRYHREYFESSDRRIRATIDSGLTIYDQRYKPALNVTRRANIAPTIVIEFKFAREDRDYASDAIQGIPIRVGRHSKYMFGVSAIANAHP